jgi:hypothetical protein
MHRTEALLAGSFLALLVGGCAFNAERTGPGTGTGNGGRGATIGTGTGASGGGARGGTTGVTDGGGITPSADANCGLQTYGLDKLPPDLLLILDKSGSMGMDAAGQRCNMAGCSKWDQMTGAINTVVAMTETTTRWGLKFFPNDNACGVNNGVTVPIGPNNAAAINGAIAGVAPGGNTPTRSAETSGGAYLMGLPDPNPKFIVLATDGLPNCGMGGNAMNSDAPGAERAVLDVAMMGIQTFVIGIATQGSNADATLTTMAMNGGRPRAGTPPYYPVTNGADLVTALGTIQGQITSCTFNLGTVPPDPSNIAVMGDGHTIPKSDTNGWSYVAGMRSVILNGSYCDAVKAMTLKSVQAIFGCPGQVIPIVP